MKRSLRRALWLFPVSVACLVLGLATTGAVFAQEEDSDRHDRRRASDFENRLERAAEEGDWEEFGELWGEWGEEFGEKMGAWGEKFGESFAESFSEQDWEDFGENWEEWGEDLARKMDEVDWEAYGRDWEVFGEEMERAFEGWSGDESLEELGASLDAALEGVNWGQLGELLGETFSAMDFEGLGDLISDSVEFSIDASTDALEDSLEALEDLDNDNNRDGRVRNRE